jgi:hypothetical protein
VTIRRSVKKKNLVVNEDEQSINEDANLKISTQTPENDNQT